MSTPSVHADAPPSLVTDSEGIRYETGPQLGRGGFAICHRADVQGRNVRPATVALKIVRSKMDPPKLAQKFVTELQIHSKLSHPNIVEFYRAFSHVASTYVVLEICENGSLADAIKKRKYFTMPEIRRFMIQTCGAIKYLHQRSIVHRDLKTGNLFLDKDMNVKVGDFGLAALLVSPNDLSAIRRSTMCGTPNYLAPEVLEKSGKGHNEMVDLWAIGIIMYTLAVGRAPFHAAKREDIYRKLKAREYHWPNMAKFSNEISTDLRDVVGSLLVHENDRPTPDQIVSHPFFKLHFIPLQLDKASASQIPTWPSIGPPSSETIRRGHTSEWATLCQASAVGEYQPGKTYGAFGSRKNKSVARDCHKEIEAERQPTVPFPEGTVYMPFPVQSRGPFQGLGGLSEITEERESSADGAGLTVPKTSERAGDHVDPPEDPALLATTANDRVKERIGRTTRKEEVQSLKENAQPLPECETARPMAERPTRMRSIRKISNQDRVTAVSAPIRASRGTRTIQRAKSTRGATKEKDDAQALAPLQTAASDTRPPAVKQHPSSAPPLVGSAAPSNDDHQSIPYTDSEAVLARIYSFRDNVSRALDKKSTKHSRTRLNLPFVSKWVDYSRKHGVGYVLEDGSIGCLVAANAQHPVTHTISRDGLAYLTEIAKDAKSMERVPLEYYTDSHGTGLAAAVLDKERRRQANTVWMKFGKYMCQQLGQVEGKTQANEVSHPTTFVRFYQRLGNVGVWGFVDGSFQFNFPDHTKLVFQYDGSFCAFTCLSVEATKWLDEKKDVPYRFLKTREHLLGSPSELLYGGSPDLPAHVRDISEANCLRMKLRFILAIVDGWRKCGGLGRLEDPRAYEWTGPQLEDTRKQDWVTVGRCGGDD